VLRRLRARLVQRRDEAVTANVQAQLEAAGQEAQRQDRLNRAYTELGMYLSRHADWARSVQPFWGTVPPPDPLPPEDRWKVETLVTLYGSPDVRRLLDQWIELARKIDYADDIIRRVEQSRNPRADADGEAHREQLALPDYKAAMSVADEAIRIQMNRELAGERLHRPAPSQLNREPHAEAVDEGQGRHELTPPVA
jgi:hypothetical protein